MGPGSARVFLFAAVEGSRRRSLNFNRCSGNRMDPVLEYRSRLSAATEVLRSRWGEAPALAVGLGSGLSGVVPESGSDPVLEFRQIPHFPAPQTPGHPGRIRLCHLGPCPVAVLDGRVHLYESHPAAEVVFPVRVLAWWGVREFILTNAAGGIHPDLSPGDLMVVEDHLNLTATSPLEGPHLHFLGERFPDLTEAYSRRLVELLHRCARQEGLELKQGVYAAVRGPNYETPAEIRMLRQLGADAVGMSTVPEVIALRQMGREVAAVSCITNLAAGTLSARLDHADVLETARCASTRLSRLLTRLVQALEGCRQPDTAPKECPQ